MKASVKRRVGSGLFALAISQVLLLGCATTNRGPMSEQAQGVKYEQKIDRTDAHFRAE